MTDLVELASKAFCCPDGCICVKLNSPAEWCSADVFSEVARAAVEGVLREARAEAARIAVAVLEEWGEFGDMPEEVSAMIIAGRMPEGSR